LLGLLLLATAGCNIPKSSSLTESKTVPAAYYASADSANAAQVNWREYFSDPELIALIDTALKNNQELNIMLQEIEISRNEVRARKGEYLPTLNVGGAAGLEKPGRFTRDGAVEENLEIDDGTPFPEPLTDYTFGAYASWEVDVWKKLRNAKQSANNRYLASVEGKNFMVTNLVAEIAASYYELMALDNKLQNIEQNIVIQSNALAVAKQQKDAAMVTQLAVNRFEAQLLNTQNLQFEVKQSITETENRINFLTGRFPQPVKRNAEKFLALGADSVQAGVPSQLLQNRPDILQAEQQLMAAKLDVKVARANFYPSFRITGGAGFQAFNPAFLINPQSLMYSLAGDLVAPVINRNAIQAAYAAANAKQVQAVYNYQQTVLNAYVDVLNQLSKTDNYRQSYAMKSKEAEILTQSVAIANSLFNSARADYSEVLLTQREALDSKMELIEIKMKQLSARVNIYRALGGGWK
jgi:NodT family efflux transporter outer membrane factor (OMF) lipoprotein